MTLAHSGELKEHTHELKELKTASLDHTREFKEVHAAVDRLSEKVDHKVDRAAVAAECHLRRRLSVGGGRPTGGRSGDPPPSASSMPETLAGRRDEIA